MVITCTPYFCIILHHTNTGQKRVTKPKPETCNITPLHEKKTQQDFLELFKSGLKYNRALKSYEKILNPELEHLFTTLFNKPGIYKINQKLPNIHYPDYIIGSHRHIIKAKREDNKLKLEFIDGETIKPVNSLNNSKKRKYKQNDHGFNLSIDFINKTMDFKLNTPINIFKNRNQIDVSMKNFILTLIILQEQYSLTNLGDTEVLFNNSNITTNCDQQVEESLKPFDINGYIAYLYLLEDIVNSGCKVY